MRIRLPVGRTLFLAAATAFALVALLPLRLTLDWLGFERVLAARAATGSVWLGALQEAQIGPVALGDVEASLDFLPLLLGRARVSLERPDADTAPFEGAVTVSRHSFGVDDVTGRLRTGTLFAPLPIAAVDLDDLSAGFESGRCTRAGGRVHAAVSGDIAGIALASGLSGNARCAADALLLPLVSQTGMEQLNLRLFADGRYRVDLVVRTDDASARQRLAAAGFRPFAGGYAMRIDGAF